MKRFGLIAAVAMLPVATASNAQDRTQVVPSTEATASFAVETLPVVIRSEEDVLWSGTLTIGPRYGRANFSQSKNEFAQPCGDARFDPNDRSNTNNSFNFSISRSNWQQQPNSFNLTFNRTEALRACEGQGSNSSGFNRIVEIERGSSVTIESAGGVAVTVSRP